MSAHQITSQGKSRPLVHPQRLPRFRRAPRPRNGIPRIQSSGSERRSSARPSRGGVCPAENEEPKLRLFLIARAGENGKPGILWKRGVARRKFAKQENRAALGAHLASINAIRAQTRAFFGGKRRTAGHTGTTAARAGVLSAARSRGPSAGGHAGAGFFDFLQKPLRQFMNASFLFACERLLGNQLPANA